MNSQNVTIKIENLKCHGCANTITSGLRKFKEVENVIVRVEDSTVMISFNGSDDKVDKYKKKLANLGYPETGENSRLSIVKSYVSCAIGRIHD